jgi:hypothetical protein
MFCKADYEGAARGALLLNAMTVAMTLGESTISWKSDSSIFM